MKNLMYIFLISLIFISKINAQSKWTVLEKLYKDSDILVEIQFRIENTCKNQKRTKYKARLNGTYKNYDQFVNFKIDYTDCNKNPKTQNVFIQVGKNGAGEVLSDRYDESMDYTFETENVQRKFYDVKLVSSNQVTNTNSVNSSNSTSSVSVTGNTSKTETTFSAIYQNLSSTDKQSWDAYIALYPSISFWNEKYEVYEKNDVKAKFTIPANCQLVVQSEWYYGHNSTNDLHFYALPFNAGTFINGTNLLKSTFESIALNFTSNNTDNFNTTTSRPDTWTKDDYNQTAYYETFRTNNKFSINFVGRLKGNFMIVSCVIYTNSKYVTSNIDYIKQVGHYYMAMGQTLIK